MEKKINVSIPQELAKRLGEKIKGTSFKSIQEYALYILEQIASSDVDSGRGQAYSGEEEADIKGDPELAKALQPYTEDEEESIKKNLEDMGYI